MQVQVDDAGGTLRDISNDVTNFQFGTPRAVQDVTGVDKSAIERLLLLSDFTIEMNGAFNPETNFSHDVFKTVPSSAAQRTVTLTISGQVFSHDCIFTDYSWERADDGGLSWNAPGQLANGTAPTWA
jgi:hypothetical protein